MRLGISSYTYTWAVGVPGYPPPAPLDAFGLLQRAAQHQVRVLQIADNLPLDLLPLDTIAALARRADELGITIEVGTRGIGPEHLRTYLKLAQQLASPIVRVVVDTAAHHPDPAEVVTTLTSLERDFRTAGVTLAVENHDRFTAGTLLAIINQLGTWVGICLDTVNSLGALEGPELVVNALAGVTVNLHIKDFTVRRADHQMGFSIDGRAAGQGRLDIPRVLRELASQGRDPNVILELWTPPAATLPETLALEQRWANESICYLRTLLPD